MDHLNTIVAVVVLQLLAVISPGPNFAIVSRLSIGQSKLAGLGAAFGISLGATLYAILSITGLSALLERVAWLTQTIQILGGLYLLYLGIKAWRTPHTNSQPVIQISSKAFLAGIKSGLLVSLSNPKAIAFFIGLYAVAIPPSTPTWAKISIILGGLTVEIAWYSFVGLILSLPAPRRFYTRFTTLVERSFGSLLCLLGIKLVWQNIKDLASFPLKRYLYAESL